MLPRFEGRINVGDVRLGRPFRRSALQSEKNFYNNEIVAARRVRARALVRPKGSLERETSSDRKI